MLFLTLLDKMTKENREKAYLHFRDLENNYTALEHLNNGITATSYIREKAKKDADKLLARNPELAELELVPKEKEVMGTQVKKSKKNSKE